MRQCPSEGPKGRSHNHLPGSQASPLMTGIAGSLARSTGCPHAFCRSFFYWGTGVALGLLQGYVYLITTYSAQLLVDTMDVFRECSSSQLSHWASFSALVSVYHRSSAQGRRDTGGWRSVTQAVRECDPCCVVFCAPCLFAGLRTPAYLEKAAAGRIGVQPSPDLHHSALTQKAKTKLQRALDKEDETVPRACPRPQTTPKKPTGAKTTTSSPVSSY